MNIYGDRGNILTLRKRAEWRGIPVEVTAVGRGSTDDLSAFDLLFWGGGQDRDQGLIFRDLIDRKARALRRAVDQGIVVLAVCGGFQLLGEYYQTASGARIDGLGLLDLRTEAGSSRRIGNVLVDASELRLSPATLVGFENHSGRTHLGAGLRPLGRVLVGAGNNGEDGTEGVAHGNVFGTYLHGSLLPKNPHFADLLIERALQRRDPAARLRPLNDEAELAAHQQMAARIRSGQVVHASAR